LSTDDIVVMGQIGAPFGIKGWVKVFADTEHPDSLFDYPIWYIETPKGWQAFEIENAELHTKNMVAKLAGVDDRDVAESFRKRKIGIPRSQLPEPEDGEYYWSDLIGLQVVNLAGEALGQVSELLETGANDVLVVRDGDTERLLPFVDAVVKTVDLAAATITVDWGLDY